MHSLNMKMVSTMNLYFTLLSTELMGGKNQLLHNPYVYSCVEYANIISVEAYWIRRLYKE